jgi:hypothetical protein
VIYIKNHHGILKSVEKDSKLLYLRAPTIDAAAVDAAADVNSAVVATAAANTVNSFRLLNYIPLSKY